MATRYDDFGAFMADVTKTANSRENLESLFRLRSARTVGVILSILGAGWFVFVALAALLGLGAFAFGIALISFLITPPGLIIAAILGVGAGSILYSVYKDRELPLAIKRVGDTFKPLYDGAQGRHADRSSSAYKGEIDQLFEAAVQSLLAQAQS